MANYVNKKKKECKYPYNKFSEFLDRYDFLELFKEFSDQVTSILNIWIPLDSFIVFVYDKLRDDFKIYCNDNNISKEERDLLISIESRNFWDEYIKDKTGLWTSDISAYNVFDIDRVLSANSNK